MILSRTARSAAAFGGLRSLTRSSTRTECCPSDQGRSLGLSKTWIGGRRWDKLCPRSLSPAPRRAANNTSGNAMQLSPAQLKEFDEQGYLFFPNCFSEEEIALLRDDAEAILKLALFLDEVMPINGPLLLIPKSHKQGVLNAGHDPLTTSYPLWTLDKETVTRLRA